MLGNVFANLGRPDVQMRQAKEIISQLLSDGPKPQREVMEKLRAAVVARAGVSGIATARYRYAL